MCAKTVNVHLFMTGHHLNNCFICFYLCERQLGMLISVSGMEILLSMRQILLFFNLPRYQLYQQRVLVKYSTSFMSYSLKLHFLVRYVNIYKTAKVMDQMLNQSFSQSLWALFTYERLCLHIVIQ